MSDTPREPTADECQSSSEIKVRDDWAFACWYPQMGGYHGKCVVTGAGEGCFDAYVWHDGTFPFGDGGQPVRLHHCSPEQFIEFGQTVQARQERWDAENPAATDRPPEAP